MIKFFIQEHQLRNGSIAKTEMYEFWTDEMILNGSGHVVCPSYRAGRVDESIKKEHAAEYAAFRDEIDNPKEEKV